MCAWAVRLLASGSRFDAWDVDRLVELSRDLPIETVSVQAIGEIDTEYGFAGSAEVPMVRRVVEHAKLIAEVDLSFPIILGHDGRVVDGMHRIARALFEGRREVAVGPFPRADRAGLLQLTI